MSAPEGSDQDGQVSAVTNLDPTDADTPIDDGDSVSGSPSEESGRVEEGQETGPDARSGREYPTEPTERARYGDKSDRYSSGPPDST